jgi:ferredoxin
VSDKTPVELSPGLQEKLERVRLLQAARNEKPPEPASTETPQSGYSCKFCQVSLEQEPVWSDPVFDSEGDIVKPAEIEQGATRLVCPQCQRSVVVSTAAVPRATPMLHRNVFEEKNRV